MPSEPAEVEEVIRWRRVEDGPPTAAESERLLIIYGEKLRNLFASESKGERRVTKAFYFPKERHFSDGSVIYDGVTHFATWPRGPEGGRT